MGFKLLTRRVATTVSDTELLDGFSFWNGAVRSDDLPECYRDLLIPLDAPLAWVHQVIQKVFYWADYHLHEFQFLDAEARRLLGDAFRDLFDVKRFMDDEPNEFAVPGGELRFSQASHMSLRWLYRDFASAAEREGMLDGDYPEAQLPESQPIGLFLLGSAAYADVLMRMRGGEVPGGLADISQGLYYHYDYGSDKELSISALEYSIEDAYGLPRIVGAVGHTPPEDSGMSQYRELVGIMEERIRASDEGGIDLPGWAHNNGWRPFTTLEDLQDFFDRRTGTQ